ncbi:MAG: glycosyltransferase [Selenomonadales bacterium]|nr:glycosyltransferase [Selenomonadales bacterium]
MANVLIDKGYEVVILNYNDNMGEPPYPLHDKVRIVGAVRGRLSLFERIRRNLYRKPADRHAYEYNILDARRAELFAPVIAEEAPDIIISYHAAGTRILQAGRDPGCPVITMFHFNPETVIKSDDHKKIIALEQCSRVQVLMESYIDGLKKYIKSDNIVHIPNVVPQFDNIRADFSSKIIVHVGRFDQKQKRQHLLIEAFAKVAAYDEAWTVEFWGDDGGGTDGYCSHCRELVKKYGLEDRVKFCGTTAKIIEEMQRGSVYCFPSAYEGFPLAMTEAMSIGLPVIGYKNCPAVNELVLDGVNGLLCDEGVEPLAEALSELMQDEAKRKRYGDNAKQDMKQYAPEVVWDMWDKLIREVVCEYNEQKK